MRFPFNACKYTWSHLLILETISSQRQDYPYTRLVKLIRRINSDAGVSALPHHSSGEQETNPFLSTQSTPQPPNSSKQLLQTKENVWFPSLKKEKEEKEKTAG